MKLRNAFFVMVVFLLMMAINLSCSTDTVSPEIAGITSDFYPLKIGRYAIYDVEETKYTFVNGTINRKYQIKELISDTFRLQDKTLAFRLERYSRNDTAQEWSLDSIYVAYKTGTEFIRVESSIPYLKLKYPLRTNVTWNGNLYNNNSGDVPEIYKVLSLSNINDSTILGQKSRVIKVLHRSDSNCTSNYYSHEKYAENIGLIERVYRSYGYKETSPPCTGPANVEVGKDYRERIVEVGF